MALGSSKPTASITKQRLSLPSPSSVVPTSPMVSFPTSSSLHSPCSISCPWKKLFPSNIIKAGSNCDDMMLAKQFNHEDLCLDMEDAAYASWMMDYPSALTMFEQMMSATKGKQIAVFLDYDGTLSPIVDDPEEAFMSDEMRSIVREVAKYFPTAIISGRCKDKVYEFVKLAELYYAGSHGMDIMAPSRVSNGSKNGYMKTRDKKDDENVLFQAAKDFLPMIDEVYKLLLENTKRIPGVRVENNKFCASVHFRCVEEKNWSALAEKVRNVLQAYPLLHLTQGKKVLEIRPLIKWHKGDALEFLLQSLGLASSSDVFPLYIGDDRTDEDAFKVLKARGQGFSILVSSVPKESNASYSLRDPSEVLDFLHHLVKWKQSLLNSRSKV